MASTGGALVAGALLFLVLDPQMGAVEASSASTGSVPRVAQDGQCSCGGWTESEGLTVGGTASSRNDDAAPADDGGPRRASSGPTAYWTSERVVWRTRGGGMGVGLVQEVEPPCTTGDGRQGQTFRFVLHAATGEVIRREARCVADGDDPDPAAQGFADGPTVEQLLDVTVIPEAAVHVDPSPEVRGLTGLESYFWSDPPGEVTVDDSGLGWTVSAALQPIEWRWDVGDTVYTTSGSGSQAAPAVEHLYETKGTRTVTVTVTWEGSYAVSNPELGVEYTVPGLSTPVDSSLEYQVVEARVVLDEEDAR